MRLPTEALVVTGIFILPDVEMSPSNCDVPLCTQKAYGFVMVVLTPAVGAPVMARVAAFVSVRPAVTAEYEGARMTDARSVGIVAAPPANCTVRARLTSKSLISTFVMLVCA